MPDGEGIKGEKTRQKDAIGQVGLLVSHNPCVFSFRLWL